SPYLLTGLLVCGLCGNIYVSKKYEYKTQNKNGPKTYLRHCYGCTARVKRDKLYTKIPKCENEIIRQEVLNEYVLNNIKLLKFTNFKENVEANAISLIEMHI